MPAPIPTAPAPAARIDLPRPVRSGGRSVVAALWRRRTDRSIGSRPLPPRLLSNLLWAAGGVNRAAGQGPFGGVGRTAASASNAQEIDVYVALPAGLYLYDGLGHRLTLAAAGDHRPLAISPGQRPMLGDAAVHLVYVVDLARYDAAPFQEPGLHDAATRASYAAVAVGLIAGNVELFAASAGLSSWFHNCDRPALGKVLRLGRGRRALYAHTVGRPVRRAAGRAAP